MPQTLNATDQDRGIKRKPPPQEKADVPTPHAEDEGLTRRQIKWIPLVVPLAALGMALGATLVLSMA